MKTLWRLGWQLRGRVMGGDLVLGYHRVADTANDPWDLCVPPALFHEQMGILRRHYRPVPLSDLALAASGGMHDRRPRVAVTFDDGYADVLENALPVLEEMEVPATIFVVLEGMRGSFWWDRLANLLAEPDGLPGELELEVDGQPVRWSRTEGTSSLYGALYAGLRRTDPARRHAALDSIQDRLGVAAPAPPPPVLSRDEVAELGRHRLVEIGSHGATHQELRGLARSDLDREIRDCRRELEELLGKAVESFSYPHGVLDAVSRNHVAQCGYSRACASWNGLIHEGSDPFRLPRLWPSDMPASRFRAWLRSWAGR